MPNRAGILTLALLTATALASPAESQETKPHAERLADGVWAAQPARGANVGWFLLGDGVVAVDTGGDVASGKQILELISETTSGKPVRTVILTHVHGDHMGGVRAFAAAGARVICQENVNGPVLSALAQSSADPSDPLASKPGARPLVESISERSILADGIRNAQIYFLGPAHTRGDLLVYLPAEKILFAGDVALNALYPYMQSPDMDPIGWERALAAISKISPAKMVPGHGAIGPVSGLSDTLAYVQRVLAVSKKIVDKGISDETVDIEIRAPENQIPNVVLSDTHIANVKAVVKSLREKAQKKSTPSPTAAPKTAATPAPK